MTRPAQLLFPVLILLGALGACAQPAPLADGANSARPAADAAPPINAICPIGKDKVYAAGKYVMFRGYKIGFCCDECAPDFEKLDDAGKIAALAAVGTPLPAR